MRTVNQLIAAKGIQFNVIDADATVLEALSFMKCENHNYLVVLKNQKYMGIFSENDYARKVILMERASANTRVKDVMTTDLPIVNGSDSIERCMRLFDMYKTRYMPVYNYSNFAGVVTIHDLMREAVEDAELHLAGGGKAVVY